MCVCVSGGLSWFDFCYCAKTLPRPELRGKGLCVLDLHHSPWLREVRAGAEVEE